MKTCIFLLSTLLLFSFTPEEEKTFTSNNKKISITAPSSWQATENMKGVEIYIQNTNEVNNTVSSVVISKDETLLLETTLENYSAGKIFLQTAVLNTTPSMVNTKEINGLKMKVYEYEYSDKELNAKHSMVLHCVIGNVGYQIVATGPAESFEISKPLFNQIINSLTIK